MSFPRLPSLLLAAILSSFVIGCADCGGLETPDVPNSTRPSLGELVYRIIKQDLSTSADCPAQYVTALEVHHEDFVTTFDYVIENGVQDDFPDLLGGTIKPFVDNGKLPALVDQLAETLALLVSDEFDPNRDTLQAFVNLSNAQTLLESSIAIQTVSALLADPTITDKVHALATLAQENDGVTYVMDDIIDVAAYALEADATPSTCTGLPTPDVQTTLLRTAGFVEDTRYQLGSAFYIARPDANGNPAVSVVNGSLLGPFVDADNDDVADVDAEGEPVDASGQRIDLPMIGEDGATGRDASGRAVDAQGRPIYQYYDVKRTALSYTVQLGADLFEDGIHHEIPAIATAALGQPATCTDGTNCRQYAVNNHPIADLLFVTFEALKFSRTSVLLRTMTQLLTTNPTKAEELLVAVGDIIKALDATTISITDTSVVDAVIGLVPLIEDILQPVQGRASTARVLVDVLQGLGAQADALPADINYMIRYQWDPDAANDLEMVNLSAARFVGGDDNRTGLEQLIELFEYADCGYVGPDGILTLRNTFWVILRAFDSQVSPGTLAEVFVDILSRMSPSTVITLQGLLNSIQNLVGNGLLSSIIQTATGCSALQSQKTAEHLPSLGILAQSGGLDWILPLANTFKQQGQLRLLIDVFAFIARELRYDEDPTPSSVSAVRRILPALRQLTTEQQVGNPTSTPLNRVLDALDILLTIPASDGNGNSVDVIIDALGYMTCSSADFSNPGRCPTSILTRAQNGAGTSGVFVGGTSILTEILKKVKVLQMRVAAGGAADELTRVIDMVTPLLTSTTGAGTARRLANPNLRLLAATYLDVAAQATALPSQQYTCYVNDLQTESAEFLVSKHFATVVRLFNHLATSPNAGALEDWVLEMLRGKPNDRDGELYGRALQLAAGALSSDAASDDLSKVLAWLAAGIQVTGAGGVREMIATFDELLQSDTNGTILRMTQTLIEPGPLTSRDRPVTTFLDIASAVGEVDPGNMCMATGREVTAADLETTVDGLSEFLTRDPNDGIQSGIEQIWPLVGALAPAE